MPKWKLQCNDFIAYFIQIKWFENHIMMVYKLQRWRKWFLIYININIKSPHDRCAERQKVIFFDILITSRIYNILPPPPKNVIWRYFVTKSIYEWPLNDLFRIITLLLPRILPHFTAESPDVSLHVSKLMFCF